jgi:phosphate/sulfate permease
VDDLAVVVVVAIALAFDYVNGFHDAANSIATVVSTRVLSPRTAVAWAAFFNFVAFLVFGTHVAATIAKGVVDPGVLSIGVVFAGLIGAIGWNLITFYLGLPTSSSHALVGGIAGAAVAKGGFHVLVGEGLRTIGVFIVLSPLAGLALGLVLTVGLMWAVHRYRNVDRLNRVFRRGSRRRRSASATAATTPRRRWASSSPCSSPRGTCRRTLTCRCGSCCRPTSPSASAPCRAGGGS